MKYRATITNIIPLIRNVKKYKNAFLTHDAIDTYMDVDTIEEADLIEDLNYYQLKVFTAYQELIELTTK